MLNTIGRAGAWCRILSAIYSLAFVGIPAILWLPGLPVLSLAAQPARTSTGNAAVGNEGSNLGTSGTGRGGRALIPNIIHFTWLPKEDNPYGEPLPAGAQLTLKFNVQAFLSVYAARHHHPDARIIIHFSTPRQPRDLCSVYKCNGWLNATLSLGVEVGYLPALRKTARGVAILTNAQRSDWVRLEALLKYGGIYQDLDSYMLRSFDPLRRSGFRNLVGLIGEWPSRSAMWPGNGLLMAAPNSTFMAEVRDAMHERFKGEWGDNCDILGDVTNQRAGIPNEVLVMPQQGFFPYSWEPRSPEMYLCQGAEPPDLRYSYAFHLYSSMIDHANREARDMQRKMTVEKLLTRRCNFCRLMRPYLQEAISRGLIKEDW